MRIRIRTRIRNAHGYSRVLTLFQLDKWITIGTDMGSVEADSLFEAGQNHLNFANAIREKFQKI